MARLGDLKVDVIETIALALAAGMVYFIALYVLEHSPKSRPALWIVVAGAVLFRLTLYSLTPSLSTDIQRYRWDGRVQKAGWNPYALAPNDPRLAYLRDPGWVIMPGPEIPSMYPPLSQLVFRAGAPVMCQHHATTRRHARRGQFLFTVGNAQRDDGHPR